VIPFSFIRLSGNVGLSGDQLTGLAIPPGFTDDAIFEEVLPLGLPIVIEAFACSRNGRGHVSGGEHQKQK
jgi:hypothetical protein